SRLADQLVEPRSGCRSLTVFVDVKAVRRAWRFSIDQHAERHGPLSTWPHDQVDVARVEAERDPPICLVPYSRPPLGRPVAGLSLETVGSDGHQAVTDAVASALAQQPLDDPFALFVLALAELVVPDSSLRVGEVRGRPVPVCEGLPDRVAAVERDRILDAHVLRRPADVVDVLFEWELRRVNADHDQPLVLILPGPGADIAE